MPVIQNVEKLKAWLKRKLEPICEADPVPLSKYVVALVKKDKSEQELKEICTAQLEVFLVNETEGFINELFVAIATKSYMTEDGSSSVQDSPTADLPLADQLDSLGELLPPPLPQPQEAADASALREEIISSSKVGDTGKRSSETAEEGDREHRRLRRSRSRSRSHSPGRRRRTREDDRPRRRDDRYDRHTSRYHGDRDRGRDRYGGYRGGRGYRGARSNRDRPYSDRRDDRRDDRRESERHRSHSRSRSRSHSHSRSRSGSPAPPSGSALNSVITIVGGNQGDQPGMKPIIRDRCRDYDEKGFCMRGELCPFDHGNDPVIVDDVNLPKMLNPTPPLPAQPPPSQPPPPHINPGMQPRLPPPAGVPFPGPFMPPMQGQQHGPPRMMRPMMPPNSHGEPFLNMPPNMPPMGPPPHMVRGPTMLRGPPPMSRADGMSPMQRGPPPPMPRGPPPPNMRGPMPPRGPPGQERNNMRMPHLHNVDERPPGPPPLRFPPPNREGPPRHLQTRPNRPPMPFQHPPRMNMPMGPPPGQRQRFSPPRVESQQPQPEAYNPENPALDASPFYVPRANLRTLVGVQTVPLADKKDIEELEAETEKLEAVNTRTVLVDSPQSTKDTSAGDSRNVVAATSYPISRKRPYEPDTSVQSQDSGASSSPSKMVPDSTRKVISGGGEWRPRKAKITPNSRTLEIKKIPRELNSIAKLNEHFQKFGVIKNLQVAFGGQPDAALVTYNTHLQARAAHNSIEAVLNNRFIKVFWHNENQDGSDSAPATSGSERPSIKERLGIPTKEQLTFIKNKPEASADRVVISKGSGTSLSKTVYNPAALKASSSTPSAQAAILAASKVSAAKEAVRRKHDDQRRQMQKKQIEIRKQKQELLVKLIQQQKSFLEKLENKSLPAESRAEIMGFIKKLSEQVDKTKKELEVRPRRKSQTECQKELLDTELELYNQQCDGGDATELYKRVAQLRKEIKSRNASLNFMNAQAARGASARGRGRGRGHGRARRLSHSSTTIDKRPRELTISGFELDDKDEVLTYFSDLGEIEHVDYNEALNKYTIGYKTRQEAEFAVKKGSSFKGKPLLMVWHIPKQVVVAEEAGPDTANDAIVVGGDLDEDEDAVDIIDDDLLLDDDEEDDEDAESRGWRR